LYGSRTALPSMFFIATVRTRSPRKAPHLLGILRGFAMDGCNHVGTLIIHSRRALFQRLILIRWAGQRGQVVKGTREIVKARIRIAADRQRGR